MSLFSIYILAVFLLAATRGTQADPISVEACRHAGFDPWQLSCSTCELLPEAVKEFCQSCCLSYKTLEKRTHRYQAAVLIHTKKMPHYFPEVDTLLKEDLDSIWEKKGSARLVIKDVSSRPEPSAIFWFDEIPASWGNMDVDELQQKAAEIIVLDGWKRDDVRDMLLALLPDK
jgi:hypothetical protein